MSRTNILDLYFDTCQISRSITDSMWRFDMEIDKDYPCPALWEPVEAVLEEDGNKHCLFVGFPISKQKVVKDGDEYTRLSGVSYGWYVANKPLRPADRLLQSTTSGTSVSFEDPLTYLDRLIFASNTNPCGLIKENWDSTTNNWGTSTLPGIQFEQNENSTIQSAIDEISAYTGLIHFDYWKLYDPDYYPVSYCVNESNLDTSLNLPDPLIIESSDDQIDARTHRMIEDIQSTEEGDNWKNRVYVDAKIQDATDTYYSAVYPASWDIATNGLERPYQYCEELPPGTSASAATNWAMNRAKSIYSLLCTPTTTFEVPFWYKFDLQLFQKIQFLGFGNIPEDQMRITELRYDLDDDNGVVCSARCALDREWAAARKHALILKLDSLALQESINKVVNKKIQTSFLATITGVTSGAAIYQSVAGRAGYAATPNQ